MTSNFINDLIVLVADKNTQFTLKGLFARYQSFGIKDISKSFDQIFVHPLRDPGCYSQCVDFLRPYIRDYKHALVLFDHEGSGQESKSREALEIELENKLNDSGWGDRASVIILEPEIEAWVWSDSPNVDEILGWQNPNLSLRNWLVEQNFLEPEKLKPVRPKESLEATLRQTKKPRSSAIYLQLAEKVSFQKCTDSSFLKLKEVLQTWFSDE